VTECDHYSRGMSCEERWDIKKKTNNQKRGTWRKEIEGSNDY
jgi:hypothetical protein